MRFWLNTPGSLASGWEGGVTGKRERAALGRWKPDPNAPSPEAHVLQPVRSGGPSLVRCEASVA